MIRARTDTIQYATADTDTSTPCVGVPATYSIRPGRSLRERSLYVVGGTLYPRRKYTDHQQQTKCTQSVLRLVDW